MRKMKALFLAVLLAAGLIMAGAQPASAAETGSVTFQGTATVVPGLGYNLPPDLDKTTATDFDWQFSSDICAAVSEGKKGTPALDPACSIEASGEGTGYCGWSEAPFVGVGEISAFGHTYDLGSVGWAKAIGGVLTVTGSVVKHAGQPSQQTGSFTAAVVAIPVEGSCLAGTATGFIIVAEAVYSIS